MGFDQGLFEEAFYNVLCLLGRAKSLKRRGLVC